jgi:hypothetical protein
VATRVTFVAHVCHVARLIPSDTDEACSLCSNIEVLYRHVHMRFMVRFNYNYLVVKNDDTKNG